jgi:hypothetical protein
MTESINEPQLTGKIPEQHTRKARYQGTTENSHIGHSTHTAESANVEEIFSMGNNITYTVYCNYRVAATLCTLQT